jgi:hypothetical protein
VRQIKLARLRGTDWHLMQPAGVLAPLVNESFPGFLDEDSNSGNDSLSQASEFSGRI